MSRLIIDGRCIFDSGIGVYIREMLMQLNSTDIEIELVLENVQVDKFSKLGIKVNKIHAVTFGRYSFKNFFYFNKITLGADYFFSPAISIPPLFCRAKRIVTVHDLCPVRMWKLFGIATAIIYWLILFFQLIVADKVVAISLFTKNELSYFYFSLFKYKTIIVPNGLSKRLVNNKHMSMSNALRSLTGEHYLLCVGNVKPHKNIINFINFFENKSSFSDKYKLVIVGQQGGFRTKVEGKQINSKSVIFTGFVSDDDLSCLYNSASAFVFPSLYEGFGLPMLEAMSYKLPVLASNIPVFREIAGDRVSYFEPNDFSNFDQLLQKVEDLDRATLNYEHILNLYTWDNSVMLFVNKVLN